LVLLCPLDFSKTYPAGPGFSLRSIRATLSLIPDVASLILSALINCVLTLLRTEDR
jgi:hypothetical protein